MSEYKAAPESADDDALARSWRPPTPPKQEKKSWLDGLKSNLQNANNKDLPKLGDISVSNNTESASSGFSAVGNGYDESLLMTTEESSFLQPDLRQMLRHEYKPPVGLNEISNIEEGNQGFDSGQDIEEQVRDQCSLFYSGTDDSPPLSSTHLSDKRFILEQNDPIVDEKETYPCISVPSSAGVQADFRRSSLYQLIEGRVQLYLPSDNVRLLMDPLLEPGILLLVKDNGPITNTPSYVLTVDEHLYRRLIKEMAARNRACGVYFCCHESRTKVDIGVAVAIVCVIFIALFINILIFPH